MLTIYHIEGRRSQAVVWLCEEIGLPYKLVFTRGDIGASANTIRGVNPLMPLAPTVRHGDKLLVETAAILQYLLSQHGKGKLEPSPTSPDYAYYLMWLHFAEGTAMSRVSSDMMRMRLTGEKEITPNVFPGTDYKLVGTADVLAFIEDYLAKHPYFGGAQFSAADIMMHFVSRLSRMAGIKASTYPKLESWRAKMEDRPAFKRMIAAALPDGKSPDEGITAAALMGRKA